MRRPYAAPVDRAFPDVDNPGGRRLRPSAGLMALIRLVGRLYLYFFMGGARVILRGEHYLFSVFDRAMASKSRVVLAFRHTCGWEPQVISWYVLLRLGRRARRAGVRFSIPPHVRFVYGYEVLRWGGLAARFIMPRLGALAVHHAKLDKAGMDRIYDAIMKGPWPVAIAPEGQVSYSADGLFHLEPGVVRMGFSAAERLADSGVPVELFPVSVLLRYDRRGERAMERLLRRIEELAGIAGEAAEGGGAPGAFARRAERCREALLALLERRYGLAPRAGGFSERMDAVIEGAVKRTGEVLGEAPGGGDHFSRMYRLRQLCWDRIFLPRKNPGELRALERAGADLLAGEAWYAARHLELVDFCWYFRSFPLPGDGAPLHRKVEYVQNLWDLASRAMGGAYADRKNIHPRRVIIRSSPPIDLSARLEGFRRDRKT
ncbi:MAG: acyltransferase, partial [Treponema sp.]|nr:acyltransferase [Treponema sp.]